MKTELELWVYWLNELKQTALETLEKDVNRIVNSLMEKIGVSYSFEASMIEDPNKFKKEYEKKQEERGEAWKFKDIFKSGDELTKITWVMYDKLNSIRELSGSFDAVKQSVEKQLENAPKTNDAVEETAKLLAANNLKIKIKNKEIQKQTGEIKSKDEQIVKLKKQLENKEKPSRVWRVKKYLEEGKNIPTGLCKDAFSIKEAEEIFGKDYLDNIDLGETEEYLRFDDVNEKSKIVTPEMRANALAFLMSNDATVLERKNSLIVIHKYIEDGKNPKKLSTIIDLDKKTEIVEKIEEKLTWAEAVVKWLKNRLKELWENRLDWLKMINSGNSILKIIFGNDRKHRDARLELYDLIFNDSIKKTLDRFPWPKAKKALNNKEKTTEEKIKAFNVFFDWAKLENWVITVNPIATTISKTPSKYANLIEYFEWAVNSKKKEKTQEKGFFNKLIPWNKEKAELSHKTVSEEFKGLMSEEWKFKEWQELVKGINKMLEELNKLKDNKSKKLNDFLKFVEKVNWAKNLTFWANRAVLFDKSKLMMDKVVVMLDLLAEVTNNGVYNKTNLLWNGNDKTWDKKLQNWIKQNDVKDFLNCKTRVTKFSQTNIKKNWRLKVVSSEDAVKNINYLWTLVNWNWQKLEYSINKKWRITLNWISVDFDGTSKGTNGRTEFDDWFISIWKKNLENNFGMISDMGTVYKIKFEEEKKEVEEEEEGIDLSF